MHAEDSKKVKSSAIVVLLEILLSISRLWIVYILLCVIILVLAVFMVWTYFYDYSLFSSVLPEFVASFLSGILGIALGFTINRMQESSRLQKRSQLALKTICDELRINSEVIEMWESNIKEGQERFRLFKTRAWNALGYQLSSFRNFELVSELAELYWELDTFNQARKKAEDIDDLNTFYSAFGFEDVKDFLKFLWDFLEETKVKVEQQLAQNS